MGTHHKQAAITPSGQAIRGEPIDPHIAAVGRCLQNNFAKIFKIWMCSVGAIVTDVAVNDFGMVAAGESQKLIDLVGCNVHQNSPELGWIKKPRGSNGGIEPMRTHTKGLDGRADGPRLDPLQSLLDPWDDVPLRKTNGENATTLRHHLLHALKLLRGGHTRLVHQHVFAVLHGGDGNVSAMCGYGCTHNEMHLWVLQQGIGVGASAQIRKAFLHALQHFGVAGVGHIARAAGPRVQQTLDQVVDVPVIDTDHPKAQWPGSGGHGAIHWFRPKEIQGT